MLVPAVGSAATYSALLRWQPSPGAAGYRVYVRTLAGSYGPGSDVGRPPPASDGTFSVKWSALDADVGYAFAVSAYGSSGLESARSNELSVGPTAPPPPPSPPPPVSPVVTRTDPPARYFGSADVGAREVGIAPDHKRASAFVVTETASVTSLWLYAGNPGVEEQPLQGIVYADDGGTPGELIASGNEVVLPSGTGTAWIGLPFDGPIVLDPGTYWLGVHAAGARDTGVYYVGTTPGVRSYNDDLYADGPSDPFGAASVVPGPISLYAEYDPQTSTPPPPLANLFGNPIAEGLNLPVRTHRKQVSAFELTEPAAVTRLWMFLANPGTRGQVTRGLIYADEDGLPGNLMASTDEVPVDAGTPPEWMPMPFAIPPILTPGRYWLGNIGGFGNECILFIGSAPNERANGTDMYGNGVNDSFGRVSSFGLGPLSVLAEYIPLTP